MITCYIIDNEHHAVEHLSNLIVGTPGLMLLGHATNPLIALDQVTTATPPDIVFIDVIMPELSGIEFAGLVNHCTTVIFTTAHPNYAVDAFEKDALDYLLKPISSERFLRSITKYKRHHTKATRDEYFYIVCDVKGKLIRIMMSDVLYVEGALNYIIIHLSDGTHHITYLAIGELLQRLSSFTFSRIHRSFIINTHRVKLVFGNSVTLEDGTVIKIGNAYKDEFLAGVNQKLIRYSN